MAFEWNLIQSIELLEIPVSAFYAFLSVNKEGLDLLNPFLTVFQYIKIILALNTINILKKKED
jgi:hypothetical protein